MSDAQGDPVLPGDGTGDYSRINEYAPPCLGRKCQCQGLCEYSWCCRCIGAAGFDSCSTPRARKKLLGFASVFNIVNLGFTILAAFSMSYNGPIVRNTCWSRARIQHVNTSVFVPLWNSELSSPGAKCEIADSSSNKDFAEIDLFIGLSGIAVDRYVQSSNLETRDPLCKGAATVFSPWDSSSLCNASRIALGMNQSGSVGNSTEPRSQKLANFCISCKDSAASFGTAMILAVVTCLPTIQTDIQRAYRKYDLNCQKFLAVFVGGLFSCVNTLASFAGFLQVCKKGLPRRPFSTGYSSIPDLHAEWSIGIGLSLLIVATLFKLVDAAIHCVIKTPSVCHLDTKDRIALGKKIAEARASSKDVKPKVQMKTLES